MEAASQIDVARSARLARRHRSGQCRRAGGDGHDSRAAAFIQPEASTAAELRARADRKHREGEEGARRIRRCEDERDVAAAERREEIMSMPRVAFVRAIMLNHWYHHRGQLLVYLRLLNQSVPSVLGPTADENPFAAA